MDEEIVDIDTTTDEGDQTEELDLFDEGDDIEQLKEKLNKKDETNKQLYARLKKAEGFELQDGKWVKPAPKPEVKPNEKVSELSQKDLYALIKADVHEDDISEVTDYAKLKGISIAEALKAPIVKTIIAERQEERETANKTSTGNVRRGPAKPNASQLLEQAKKGILPETDEEMAMLVKADFEQ